MAQLFQLSSMASVLNGVVPFTLFAPNDAALQKFGSAYMDLLKPENAAKVTQILTYHMIANQNLTSAVLMNMSSPMNYTTRQGEIVTVSKNGSHIMVSNAHVVQVDLMVSNGTIHVIDTLLIPPSFVSTPSSATYYYGNQVLFFVFVFSIVFSFLRY